MAYYKNLYIYFATNLKSHLAFIKNFFKKLKEGLSDWTFFFLSSYHKTMDRRISKSFKIIFSSLYPNFDDAERENAEEYFFFILKNYPDKSEINQ